MKKFKDILSESATSDLDALIAEYKKLVKANKTSFKPGQTRQKLHKMEQSLYKKVLAQAKKDGVDEKTLKSMIKEK